MVFHVLFGVKNKEDQNQKQKKIVNVLKARKNILTLILHDPFGQRTKEENHYD